jgi:peptidoglycan/LPS O-acetylase OafA/YrhL
MWSGFIKELRHSALSLENIKLMMDSVDYLERDSVPSAVQQFWALSIQVQFYAVWPFLLLTCIFISRRVAAGAKFYLSCIGIVLLASFAYSVITTSTAPAPAYFDPFARLWEFALGGMVAIALPRLNIPASIRLVAGWIGLAAVVSCGFVLPASLLSSPGM